MTWTAARWMTPRAIGQHLRWLPTESQKVRAEAGPATRQKKSRSSSLEKEDSYVIHPVRTRLACAPKTQRRTLPADLRSLCEICCSRGLWPLRAVLPPRSWWDAPCEGRVGRREEGLLLSLAVCSRQGPCKGNQGDNYTFEHYPSGSLCQSYVARGLVGSAPSSTCPSLALCPLSALGTSLGPFHPSRPNGLVTDVSTHPQTLPQSVRLAWPAWTLADAATPPVAVTAAPPVALPPT
jgi:hypothetical protein